MNAKKQNSFWGKGIFIFYVLFMAGMLTLVKATTTANLDLVNDDYYADSEKYQLIIEAQIRTAKLKEKPQISIKNKDVTISLPESLRGNMLNKSALFYSPSSAAEDIQIKPEFDNNGIFTFKALDLRKGQWNVNFFWQNKSGKKFILTQRIHIQ